MAIRSNDIEYISTRGRTFWRTQAGMVRKLPF